MRDERGWVAVVCRDGFAGAQYTEGAAKSGGSEDICAWTWGGRSEGRGGAGEEQGAGD